MREWQEYRAAYCGLCKELKREYGFLSRFFLNYDLVLLALFADGLADTHGACHAERCMANPFKRQPVCQSTPGLSLAADALVLTVYYKLMDDLADEPFLKRIPALALRPFAARCRKKAAARRPEIDTTLAAQTSAQGELEAAQSQSADAAADPTAQMTACLFAAAAPLVPNVDVSAARKALQRLGLFIGKIIYYLDAAEDYEKDAAHGGYNVFLLQGKTKAEADEAAKNLCRLCAGEASLCYNLLDFKSYKPLLDNILFLGIPQSIATAGIPSPKQKGT